MCKYVVCKIGRIYIYDRNVSIGTYQLTDYLHRKRTSLRTEQTARSSSHPCGRSSSVTGTIVYWTRKLGWQKEIGKKRRREEEKNCCCICLSHALLRSKHYATINVEICLGAKLLHEHDCPLITFSLTISRHAAAQRLFFLFKITAIDLSLCNKR